MGWDSVRLLHAALRYLQDTLVAAAEMICSTAHFTVARAATRSYLQGKSATTGSHVRAARRDYLWKWPSIHLYP